MGLMGYARRLLSMPPHRAARLAAAYAGRAALRAVRRRRALRGPSFGPPAGGPVVLERYFRALPHEVLAPRAASVAELAGRALDHRFDLLGSGWVRVEHGMRCAGVEGHVYDSGTPVQADGAGDWLRGRINPANLDEARRIWALVDPEYRPIDWQLDVKSGFRWRESDWHGAIRYGHLPGVDVKVPWELARMQHLPQLAWAYALARAGTPGFAPAEAYAREFRNQVLDFVATNPPGFGVNWTTAMDVGIRVASWLAAYDLFRAYGAAFDAPFEAELARSVRAHGRHLAANLEWHGGGRGNHYLADVAGLLFAAAYLPRSRETDAWLAFGVQELIGEAWHQFTDDGANFEASTPYHRLSAEMVLYGTALVLGMPAERRAALAEYDAAALRTRPRLRPGPLPRFPLPDGGESPFPAWYVARLERMGDFSVDVALPRGGIHQVGDNDSGRFLKLWPDHRPLSVDEARRAYANLREVYRDRPGEEVHLEEEVLDHRHLVAGVDGLFGRARFAAFAPGHPEREVVRLLAGGPRFAGAGDPAAPPASAGRTVGTEADWERLLRALEAGGEGAPAWTVLFDAPGEPRLYAYPDFGLYIFRAAELYLAVRCGGRGRAANGAHAHNDQLAVELAAGDAHPLRDPGTYLYTAVPGLRNAYRSAAAHCVPRVGGAEPAPLDRGLFYLGDLMAGECLYFGPRGFIGVHRAHGAAVHRVVERVPGGVRVRDFGRGVSSGPAPGAPVPFSPGYGVRHA
jgi:Heparinase II/III N-terminus/Heparinase II/III-like protein